MSQQTKLLHHFANGQTITRLEALFTYRIQNITARICDLRDDGFDIRTRIKYDPSGAEYAEYYVPANERERIQEAFKYGALQAV